jgi:hypothetical protein
MKKMGTYTKLIFVFLFNWRKELIIAPLVIAAILTLNQFVLSADTPIRVNVDNFVRAETAAQFDRIVEMAGGVNKWTHYRLPTPLDEQNVIRMNRDTLYSFAVVDITKDATLLLPSAGKRYMSVMVVDEDHYVHKVFHRSGTYKLTMKEFETPHIVLVGRILVNASDEADIKAVKALQNQIVIDAASAKPYTHPPYDQESYLKTLYALKTLSRGVDDTLRTFGKKKDVEPIRHLLGTAAGWGGLPTEEAYALNVGGNLPVGEYQITVKDVPVNGFWSISLYNKEGFFQKNASDAYSVNNIVGKPNSDGSFTVHFGGCEDRRVNCLPIMEGWNYTVRLYQPKKEILEGEWTVPSPQPVN